MEGTNKIILNCIRSEDKAIRMGLIDSIGVLSPG